MPLKRYIQLSDTIIDREKVIVINRDEKIEGRVHVTMDHGAHHYFDGDDARLVWQAFQEPAGPHQWKDED